jgi:heme oxygenase (mycobilin-producing)
MSTSWLFPTTVAGVLVVLRFAVDDAEEEFVRSAHEALEVLAARPGYLRGQLARAYDDPTVWCLDTEWESVGAYRRALGAYDVKLRATPLLARALPEASAFEPLATAEPGQPVQILGSDRAGIASRP